MNLLTDSNPLVVIDIGASNGIHKRWKKLKEPYTAVLVEPDPREYENLSQRLPSNHILLTSALFDKPGQLKLNLCKKQMCSSILESNMEFLRRFPDSDRFSIIDHTEVSVNTLDNEIKGKVDYVDFIKIDAEAAELFILKGATELLKDVIGLEIESAFAPIRKDQPVFCDTNRFMIDQGFELIDISPNYWKRAIDFKYKDNRKGQIIWADGLFFRSPEYFFNAGQKPNLKKVQRIFTTYLAYGYHDLAIVLLDYARNANVISLEQEQIMLKRLRQKQGFALLGNIRGMGLLSSILMGLAERLRRSHSFSGGTRLGNRY